MPHHGYGQRCKEYMRGNGTGEATVENTFTYDSLHRIVSAHEDYGNDNRSYSYDSLGNLTYETLQGNKSVDYKLNSLNQITSSSEDGWDTRTEFEYDKRGNLVKETYGKNKKLNTTAQYVYDETNKMVKGINAAGESSVYVYNGLGALVENVWTIAKNAYGYHDVDAGNYTPLGDISTGSETNNGHGNGNSSGNSHGNNGNGNVKNPSTVVKQFVVDYTSETYEPLTEHEINGLDYRYVYGNDRLSVNVTGVETSSGNIVENGNQIRLYYHMDYLGTADYLTSPVSLKVTSWTHYNEWGEITHNAVLKCGMRELDMVKRYATHDYDAVLNMFYAKARFYDADNRRFASVDPVKGYVSDPVSLVQYLYVKDNPLVNIDLLGLTPVYINGKLYNNMTFENNGEVYLSKSSLVRFINKTGIGESSWIKTGTKKVTTPKYNHAGIYEIDTETLVYHINGKNLYFEQFDCNMGISLRDIISASDVEIQNTISWWNGDRITINEDPITIYSINTKMKDSPVRVVRREDKVYIEVYAHFAGELNTWNTPYNNTENLYITDDKITAEYMSPYTYAELIAQGVSKEWSGIVYPNKYNKFGDYNSIEFVTRFYTDTVSSGSAKGSPTLKQQYITINVDTSTPKKETDREISHTTNTMSYWKISNSNTRTVNMYDHYFGVGNDNVFHNDEYTREWFKKVAAHEFGHVFGIGDAYNSVVIFNDDEVSGETDIFGKGDIMMTNNGIVSQNDFEMLLEAWKLNRWQDFDGKYKSPAIRSY